MTGQKLMQASSDQLLGWMNIAGLGRPYDYYVRQLRDWKASLEVVGGDEKRVTLYARTCAMALAKAHARSGSALAIGYLGKSDAFERAIETFAVGYAAQTERDHKALLQAEATVASRYDTASKLGPTRGLHPLADPRHDLLGEALDLARPRLSGQKTKNRRPGRSPSRRACRPTGRPGRRAGPRPAARR